MDTFEKNKNRLMSKKLHRGFDTMIRIYAVEMNKSEKHKFADLIVKQMNAGYRVSLFENTPKKILISKIKRIGCFFGYHDWDDVGKNQPPWPKDGVTVCYSSLHQCTKCKKEEMKGMGCMRG